MKIGIFGDVHGNIYAFEKAWRSLIAETCDLYCFVGDICGYYYYQNEIIDILKNEKNLYCVAGNHDDIFLKMLDDPKLEKEYSEAYGNSSRLLKKYITEENISFLRALPKVNVLDDFNIGMFHGSPWNYLEEYVYPQDCLDRFSRLPYRFVILGHTHYPMDRKIGRLRIINPGSIGQPRDYNSASYAIIDIDSDLVEFKRVQYDNMLMVRDVMKRREKNSYLYKILQRKER